MISLEKTDPVQYELKSISVDGLNGFLNHEVKLKEEGITIIHGPNGCGKTTLLEMVMHFYNSDYNKLADMDFKKFKLIHEKLDNKNSETDEITFFKEKITVDQINDTNHLKSNLERNLFKNNVNFFRFSFSINGKEKEVILSKPLLDNGDSHYEDSFRRNIRLKYELDGDEIVRIRNNDLIMDDIRYIDHDDYDTHRQTLIKKRHKINDVMRAFKSLNFFMVKTQRLIYMPIDIKERERRNYSNLMIERYAKDISQKIATSLAESNEKTASHNKSFPERLIQNINFYGNPSESENDIRNKYKETQDKITKILNAGLLFREKNIALPDESLNKDNIKTVLSLYLQDLNEKLSVYDDLLEKIETFQEIVGKKIRNKDMKIHYEKGFYFTSKYGDNRELKLSELSSGEQHQIVLFYELIFLAESGTYYLIDEPEISLHVDWQRSFLDDIARVEKLRGHKFIIATHSPQIIGSKRSLCVALDGGILDNE